MSHRTGGWCSNVKVVVNCGKVINFVIRDSDLVDNTQNNHIIRADNYTFTCYRKNPEKIHVTGVKNFGSIRPMLEYLSERINCPYFILSNGLCVNNSTWHFSLKNEIDLPSLCSKHKTSGIKKWKFNPGTFPAFILKTELGSAVIFNSGKINILGCKSQRDFFKAKIKVLEFLYL